MKNLFLASMFALSTNVFSSTFANLKTLSNSQVESASNAINVVELITHSTKVKVTQLKGTGSSAQKIRRNAVAQAMHTLCPFFDDGVEISLNPKNEKGVHKAVWDLTDAFHLAEGDAQYTQLFQAIELVNQERSIEIYSGSTSGNNTYGSVLGFYDLKNNEIAAFAATNCGSDD